MIEVAHGAQVLNFESYQKVRCGFLFAFARWSGILHLLLTKLGVTDNYLGTKVDKSLLIVCKFGHIRFIRRWRKLGQRRQLYSVQDGGLVILVWEGCSQIWYIHAHSTSHVCQK